VKLLKSLHSGLDKELTKAVFDHVRNYLMCAFLFAAGSYGIEYQSELFLASFVGQAPGILIIILATLLALLNFYDGLYKFSKYKYHYSLSVVLIFFYIIFTLRIVEITWSYRLGV